MPKYGYGNNNIVWDDWFNAADAQQQNGSD